jgi:acyl-CoA synthetase (AMP-forming)/AMP-acid ligase II
MQQHSKGRESAAAAERRRLHAEVQAFIDRTSTGLEPTATFERLALSILRYQAEHVPAYARLCAAAGRHPRDVDDPRVLPAIPTDAFRHARIAAHDAADDVVTFRTSGTTGGARGEHALSTTLTYERGALAWGRWALFFDDDARRSAIVLGPKFAALPDSSLFFMIQLFAERCATASAFLQSAADAPLDVDALAAACAEASRKKEPAMLLGTSFAFVHALDALGGRTFALPAGSAAMHTGGFKGRSREVAPAELRAAIARTFGLDGDAVVGEYGMTELSSQLYEGTLRARARLATTAARHGIFAPPPWLRVVAVDAETWLPVPAGQVGILRFEDLANIDGALAIQTADRGRIVEGGVELLGRMEGAPARGCSLLAPEPREP